MNKKTVYFIWSILIFFQLVKYVFAKEIISVLNNNYPFRESYSPNVIGILNLYLSPVLFGFLSGIVANYTKIRRSFIYYLNLSLLYGLINFLPYLVATDYWISGDWFNNHALLFYLLFNPILFLIGAFPYYITKRPGGKTAFHKSVALSLKDYLNASVFGILIFILNLIPKLRSDYLVGADVYYHAAMTSKVSALTDIFKSPIFFEGKNYYYSIGYYLLSYIAKLTGTAVDQIWFFYVPFCSFIFIFFFYLTAKVYLKKDFNAILATLLIFPLNQILWVDPSIRTLSYSFFMIFLFLLLSYLIYRVFYYLIFSIMFFLLSALTHPEVAIHGVLIIFLFFLFSKTKLIEYLYMKLVSLLAGFRNYIKHSGTIFTYFSSLKPTVFLLCIYLIIFFIKINYLLDNFGIGKTIIFNEIPLSILQPIGVISFLTFITLPKGIIRLLKRYEPGDKLVLAIFTLSGTSVFYFSHIWSLYHRYFTETAYFGMVLISAPVIASFFRNIRLNNKLILSAVFAGFFLLSIKPKYQFIYAYSANVGATLSSYHNEFDLIKRSTPPGSVIGLDPDNMLNRYLPFYTGRYIFGGSNIIDKQHQWQVLSFCNGPYFNDCQSRLNDLDSFFADPTKLKSLKENHRLDYLLISKSDDNTELSNYLTSNNYPVAGETENYTLFDVRDSAN